MCGWRWPREGAPRPLGGWCPSLLTRNAADRLRLQGRRGQNADSPEVFRWSRNRVYGPVGALDTSHLVRCPETLTGSSRAQTTPRGVAALAKTPGMSFGRRLARRRLDPAITPATFLDTALAPGMRHVAWRDRLLAGSAVTSQGLWTLRCACAVCEVALVGGDRPRRPGVRVRRVRSHPVDTACARRGVRSHSVRGVWRAGRARPTSRGVDHAPCCRLCGCTVGPASTR